MQVNQTPMIYTQDSVNQSAFKKAGQVFFNATIGQTQIIANIAGTLTKVGITSFLTDIFSSTTGAELISTWNRYTSGAGGGANNIAGQINMGVQTADNAGIPTTTTLVRMIWTALNATQATVQSRWQLFLNAAGAFSEVLRLEIPTVNSTTSMYLLRLNGANLELRQVKLLADGAAPAAGQRGLFVDTA